MLFFSSLTSLTFLYLNLSTRSRNGTNVLILIVPVLRQEFLLLLHIFSLQVTKYQWNDILTYDSTRPVQISCFYIRFSFFVYINCGPHVCCLYKFKNLFHLKSVSQIIINQIHSVLVPRNWIIQKHCNFENFGQRKFLPFISGFAPKYSG